MVPIIYCAREHHGVPTIEEYRARHAAAILERRRVGHRVAVHESSALLIARIDANTWCVDCECGAGNATDPEWGIACCWGCGAVHTSIQFPAKDAIAAIEAALLERPRPFHRFWNLPRVVEQLGRDETASDLALETEVLNLGRRR